MSAGVCGKRLGFEEMFETSAAPTKRSRCCRLDSPMLPSDFGFASEDRVSFLLRMFPAVDRELVEAVLKTHDHRLEDAIENLHALSFRDFSMKTADSTHSPEQKVEGFQNDKLHIESNNPHNGTPWVDMFVQEMRSASNLNDARDRTTRILEAFERGVVAQTRESDERELVLLKDQLHSLERENQILKRAVAIQHERYLEQEETVKEVQQLKSVITHYQEQIHTLEINNYTLKLHLQRAQNCTNSMLGHFPPDVF